MSSQDQKPPEERLKELEVEFKLDSRYRRRKRQIIEEAAELCLKHEINYPPWVDFWHLSRDPFQEHATSLEQAFKAGNLGALKEIVYWCKAYHEPLPAWAVSNIYKLIDTLATDKKSEFDKNSGLGKWRAWFRQYQQNMADYEIYDTIKEARGEYLETGDDRKIVEWDNVWEVAGAITANEIPKYGETRENTVKKVVNRVNKRLEDNPLQYKILHTFPFRKPREKLLFNRKLWKWIEDHVKSGSPRKRKTK